MFRRWAAIGFLFILVCIVGVTASNAGSVEAARWVYVPHNCAEWEPIAHEERNIAILETLGVHRGKTLYCGIDQSDTFAKAETWEAGKDRNQRDDTVYWGENGNFFGFTACQEGWLTEGESGLTGCGIHSIFEFPRERVRDRDSGRKLFLRYGRTYTSAPGATTNKYAGGKERVQSSGTLGPAVTFVWTNWLSGETVGPTNAPTLTQSQRIARAKQTAKDAFLTSPYATSEGMRELARAGLDRTYYTTGYTAQTFNGADSECQELGYQRARSITSEWRPDPGVEAVAWLISRSTGEGQTFRYEYRRQLYYEATCWKP